MSGLRANMNFLDFFHHSVWMNLVIMILGGSLIGYAGVRLERHADALSAKMRGKKVLIGTVLLALATSLPEIITSGTGVMIGNIDLVIHNLLGSIVMQTAVLALADLFYRGALSFFSPAFALLIQGIGLIIVLSIAGMGFAMGQAGGHPVFDFGGLSVDLWSLALVFGYPIILWIARRSEQHPGWQPLHVDPVERLRPQMLQRRPRRALISRFALWSLVILAAGWLVTVAADALAQQTRLGSSFVGVTLLAFVTSLPEISTTVSAVKNRNFEIAFANIFGSNLLVVALLGLVGVLIPRALFLSGGPSAVFTANLAVLVTCIYLVGMLERRNRKFLRMGWDPIAVVVAVAAGMRMIYSLR